MGSWWSGLSPSEALAAAHRALVADPDRNTQIVADLTAALHRGRNCLVLTRRIAHVETLTATAHRARTSSLGDAGQHVRHRSESSRAPPTDAKAGDGVLVIGTSNCAPQGCSGVATRRAGPRGTRRDSVDLAQVSPRTKDS